MTNNLRNSFIFVLVTVVIFASGCNSSGGKELNDSPPDQTRKIDSVIQTKKDNNKVSYVRQSGDDSLINKDPVITVFNSDSTKNRASFCYCQKTSEKGFKVQLYSAYSTQEDIDAGNDRIYNIIIERKKNEDFRAQFRFLNFEIQDGQLIEAYIIAKSTNPEYSGQFIRRTKIEQYEIDLSTFENHPLSNINGSFKFQYAPGGGYFDWDNGVMGTFNCINQPPKSDAWIENWNIEEWYKNL